MAQQPHTEPAPSAAEPLPENVQAKLTEVLALMSLTAEQYQQQLQITRQTAQAEIALSRRSLFLAAASLMALGAGIVMLWGSLLLLAGYLLLQVTASLPLTAGLLLILQLAALYWCWRNICFLLNQVGFSHTMAQIKDIFQLAAETTGGGRDHRATN